MRQSAQRTVSRGVRITADDGHARQRCTLLRANHVHDTLTDIVHIQLCDTKAFAVVIQGFYLDTRDRINDPFQALATLRLGGRNVVVRRCQIGIRSPRLAPGQSQPLKGLRRCHFVDQLAIDIDQRGTVVALFHQMRIPELVV